MNKLYIFIILICLAHQVIAQEHKKNKFVFTAGGGIGLAVIPYKGTVFDPGNFELTTRKKSYFVPGEAANIRLGYAPSERYFVCFNIRMTMMQSPQFSEYYEKETLVEGIMGIGFSFYPLAQNRKFFLNFLYGFSDIGPYTETNYDSHFNAGLSAGAGYHFIRRATVELDFLIGNSEMYIGGGDTWGPCMVNLTVNFINF